MRSPCRGFVRIDSGWNWTAAIGRLTVLDAHHHEPSPPDSVVATTSSSSGTSTPCSEW